MNKRRWFWVFLFIFVSMLLGALATGWNIVLIQDFKSILEPSREFRAPPWIAISLGTLGFLTALGGLLLFFLRLLREMRLNQLQSEFLAAVSHELKTPIATIELSASLLRSDSTTPEERVELWNSLELELKRLKGGVGSLLEAARWQHHEVTFQKTRVDLESWLEQSLARWKRILGDQAQLERKGEILGRPAMIDPGLLNLIFDNLLDNARKFSGKDPRVIVRSSRGAGRWRIEIQDTGWGFDPEASHRIFKKFTRLKTDAPFSIPGSGLGLYLAASASKAMGLTLRGTSAGIGRGAIFTLEGREVNE